MLTRSDREKIILEVIDLVQGSHASHLINDVESFNRLCFNLYGNGFLFDFSGVQNARSTDPNIFDKASIDDLWADFVIGHACCVDGYEVRFAKLESPPDLVGKLQKAYPFNNDDPVLFKDLVISHMFQMLICHGISPMTGITGVGNARKKGYLCAFMFLDECLVGGAIEPFTSKEYEELLISRKIPYAEYLMFLGNLEDEGVFQRFQYKDLTLFSIFKEEDIEVDEVVEVEVSPLDSRKKSVQVFN